MVNSLGGDHCRTRRIRFVAYRGKKYIGETAQSVGSRTGGAERTHR